MSQAVPTPQAAIPSRAIDGYASEIFSTIDASQLPDGITQTGPANAYGIIAANLTYPGIGIGVVQTSPVPITDVFMAILMELRSINIKLQWFNEGRDFNNYLTVSN
jgi:hypothetical protein